MSQVLPTLVTIRTCNGRIGTGFFHHPEWLVSNAHVLFSKEILDQGTDIIDYQSNTLTLKAEASYHRPFDKHTAPDLVIIKTKSRAEDNNQSLKTYFYANEGHDKTYLFYIDITNSYEIKFLRLRSQSGKYPLIYECEDGSIPQEGCSGSPIFEARLYESRTAGLQWEFKVVSALYARCSSGWYNAHEGIKTNVVPGNTKLICAIPVGQDFEQILKTLHNEQNIVRSQQMIAIGSNSNDSFIKARVDEQHQLVQINESEKKLGIERFESGDSTLDILLPEGLEKLWYQGIVDISQSLLIRSILKRELKGKVDRFLERVPAVSLKDLQEDFNSFINEITKLKDIELYEDDDFFKSLNIAKYFRMDVIGSEDCWTLDLQDNTGKQNGKPLKCDGKSLSSVFAKAKLPRKFTSINGNQLAGLFIASQEDRKAKDISCITQVQSSKLPSTKSAISKQSEKSAKNKQKYNEMKPSTTIPSNEIDEQTVVTESDEIININQISILQNSLSDLENLEKQRPLNLEEIEERKSLQTLIQQLTNQVEEESVQSINQTYDENEIFIPADGDCLYTSIFLGYLLPVTNDMEQFKRRLFELIGNKANIVNCEKFSEWLVQHYREISSLKTKPFKNCISHFRKNMGLDDGKWGGPDEIKILSQKLKIVINEFTGDNFSSHEKKSKVLPNTEKNFDGNSSKIINILQTKADAKESEFSNLSDPHRQHFRLLYSDQNKLTDTSIQVLEKNTAAKPSSSSPDTTRLATSKISDGNAKSSVSSSKLGSSSAKALGKSLTKTISTTSTSTTITNTVNNISNDTHIETNRKKQEPPRVVLSNEPNSNSKSTLKR